METLTSISIATPTSPPQPPPVRRGSAGGPLTPRRPSRIPGPAQSPSRPPPWSRAVAAPPGRQLRALCSPGPGDGRHPCGPAARSPVPHAFSACRPALPADVRARPSSPRAPSPGGRPRGPAPRPGQQRGCPSGRTAGGGPRGDAAQSPAACRCSPDQPRAHANVLRTAAHVAPTPDRRAIPADLPTSDSRTHHARRTERRTAAARRSRESIVTKER